MLPAHTCRLVALPPPSSTTAHTEVEQANDLQAHFELILPAFLLFVAAVDKRRCRCRCLPYQRHFNIEMNLCTLGPEQQKSDLKKKE